MKENLSQQGKSVRRRMQAEQARQHRDRDNARWRRFLFANFIKPGTISTAALLLFSFILFEFAGLIKSTLVACIHFSIVAFLLFLLWMPNFIEICPWLARRRKIIMLVRNLLCFLFVITLFPYQLLLMYIGSGSLFNLALTMLGVGLLILLIGLVARSEKARNWSYIFISRNNMKKVSLRGMSKLIMYLYIVFSFFIIELWFVSQLASPGLNIGKDAFATTDLLIKGLQYREYEEDFRTSVPVTPYKYLFYDLEQDRLDADILVQGKTSSVPGLKLMQFPDKELKRDQHYLYLARIAAWGLASILITFLIIAYGGINMQLMKAVLPTARHQIEKSNQNLKEIIMKSGIYARNLRDYLVREHSFTVVGGFIGTFIYLGIPTFLYSIGKYELVITAINEDTFFFAFALFAAWVGPLIVAINKVDDIFGVNFNRTIFDIIMDIQQHVIYFGYGHLGKRVVERDVKRVYTLDKENNIIELVTPDLIVARICTSALVIDQSEQDFVYSAESDLLGRYGVVEVEKVGGMRLKRKLQEKRAVCDESPWELKRNWFYSEKKPVIVPALKGNLAEPFTFARANLERAKLLISTVAEHNSVNAAFDSLANLKTKAILCITRSDQLNYLTYRASTRYVSLVYPVATQGATMGQRLWAAVEKMKALRSLGHDNDNRPKIYVIGENKAKHYMLENLWINIPGTYQEKTDWIENHVAFIVAEIPEDIHNGRVGFSNYLISHPEQNIFEQIAQLKNLFGNKNNHTNWRIEKYYLPLRFGTGGRYTTENKLPLLRIPVYDIRHAFGSQLDNIFHEALPDIIVINPDNLESSLRAMMLTIRALERVHSSPKMQSEACAEFPLMLFTLMQGSQLENITIGDISRFYNGLVMLYGDKLAQDESYPAHARWNRDRKLIVREAIIDSNSDAEEIINGIHESQFDYLNENIYRQANELGYMEINACVPNVPGCLTNLTAYLSGLRFSAKNRPQGLEQDETLKIPSFQYLRSFQMDSAGRGLVVTGYALLKPEQECIDANGNFGGVESEGHNFYTRLYINDGNDYNRAGEENNTRKFDENDPPAVPEAIDYITARQAVDNGKIKIQQFKKILLDSDDSKKIGAKACPGMNTCPVSAYQDYVVASNRKEFINPKLAEKNGLKFSQNYHCRSDFLPAKTLPDTVKFPSARIMLCARGEKGTPGLLAVALNTLLFRSALDAGCGLKRNVNDSKEWVFNIQYLKDMPCHNRHFAISRFFGYWMQRDIEGNDGREKIMRMLREENPIQLIEILPIGSAKNAAAWLQYARKMQQFINVISEKDDAYRLVWFNESLKCSDSLNGKSRLSDADILKDPPVAIIICKQNEEKRIVNRTANQAGDYKLCTICGLQGREYSCEKWRPWFKENEYRWDVVEECDSETEEPESLKL